MKLPLKLSNDNDIYWSTKKFNSYYPDIWLDIAIGGRGIGKTTGAFIDVGNRFNKRGEEFIYLRRYKPELKKFVAKKSLDAVYDGIVYKPAADMWTFSFENKVVGYGIALSTGVDFKSVNFDKVTTIIYDEATLKRHSQKRYLTDEVTMLLEFISSVVRTRTNYRVLILGNNVDLYNPYFEYFSVPTFKGVYIDRKRGLMCELPKNSPKLLEMEKKTPLYKLIHDTSYGRYHYDNEVLGSATEPSIIAEPKEIRNFVKVVIRGSTLFITFYTDERTKCQRFYVYRKDYEAKGSNVYYLTKGNEVNYFYLDYFKKRCKAILNRFYYDDRIDFDEKKTADIFSAMMEDLQ